MFRIVIETSSYVHLIAGFKGGVHPRLRYLLPQNALIFDELYHFGDSPSIELLQGRSFGKFTEITDLILELGKKFIDYTEEQLEDLRVALGDQPGGEGGEYAYLGTRAMLQFAKENGHYFYVLPGLRNGFLNFCLKYEPDYLNKMKESFLLCNILEYLFEEEFSAFDATKSKENIGKFLDYKADFQEGVANFLEEFKGSYELSKEQKNYLKDIISTDEKRLLDFLKPENLRKFDISGLDLGGDVISLFVPLPLGTLINVAREIKEIRDFKKANLNFVLSLFILKKIVNVGTIVKPPNCAVCRTSLAEIEKMTNEECEDIMYKHELCIPHMVARLDLKKRFGMYGKERLKAMKCLGDSSIWMEP